MHIQVEGDISTAPTNWVDKAKYPYIMMVDKLNSSIQMDKQKKIWSIDKKAHIMQFSEKQAIGSRKTCNRQQRYL